MFWREKNNNKNKSQLKISLSFFFLEIWIPWFFTSANSWLYSSRVSLSCLFSISRSETLWAFFWICRAYSNTGTGSETGDKTLFFICQNTTWQPTHHKKIIIKIQNFTKLKKYFMEYGRASSDNSSDIKKKLATFWKVIKTKIKSEKWNDSHPVHCVPVMLLKHA